MVIENTQGFQVIFIPETDSTNVEAHRMVDKGFAGNRMVVWTDFQSSGRGQHTNKWESEKGKNLLFTLCIQPSSLLAKNQFLLSEVVSLSVCTTLEKFHPGFKIKWPNDIYYEENKVCGILIDQILKSSFIAQSFIGVGININQISFLSDAPNPISLSQITGKNFPKKEVLELFLEIFQHYYSLLEKGQYDDLQKAYHEKLFRAAGLHTFKDANGTFQASIMNVQQDGQIILLTDKGEQRAYTFKEVKYIFRNSEFE